MGSYILMLVVKTEQEAAIEDLFQVKGWKYDKTGVVPLQREETLLSASQNSLPHDIQHDFCQLCHKQQSYSLQTVDNLPAKDTCICEKLNDVNGSARLLHCHSMTDTSACDNFNQVYQNSYQLFKGIDNSVDIDHLAVAVEKSKQFDVNNPGIDNPTNLETVEELDVHFVRHFTSDIAKSSEVVNEDSSKVSKNQRNNTDCQNVTNGNSVVMCGDNIEENSKEKTVTDKLVPGDKTVEPVNDNDRNSEFCLESKEIIDLNNGRSVSMSLNHTLKDKCNINDQFDNRLLNDFEMIHKFLKNARQVEFDKTIILPKLQDILNSGEYLWNKYSQMQGASHGKEKLEEKCVTDIYEVKEGRGSYNKNKNKEIVKDFKDLHVISEDISSTALLTCRGPNIKTEENKHSIDHDGASTGVNKKLHNDESNSKRTKWIKCEIMNCSYDIDKTFEQKSSNDVFQPNGISILKDKSQERCKWEGKMNRDVLFSEKLEKSKDNNKKETCAKFRWTVNRNLRMHRFHRKCETKPSDLDSDNYSVLENGYFCPDCMFLFRRKNKFLLHKRLKGGQCLPECIYCDADEQKDVYRCAKCPKCFQTKEMLKRHDAKHNNLFGCEFCVAEFYTVNDLKLHVQTLHPEAARPTYLCDFCGSKFKERKVLNAHRRFVHSENRPEACPSCDKCFKTKSQLKNHLVTHKQASELNLSCEICGKMFLRVATLKDHVRRHKKEFTCFCTICNKGFYRKYSLVEHMRVHTGDKPFDCKFCGFKSALSCNLVKHMKVHF